MHYCFALIGRNIPVLCAYIDITVLHCRYDSFDAIYVKCSRYMVPTCICSFMRILLFRFCAHGVDLLIIVRDIVILTYMIYTLCPSKFDTLLSNVITLSNIGRFSNFFSILICTKFVTSLLLKFPTDLNKSLNYLVKRKCSHNVKERRTAAHIPKRDVIITSRFVNNKQNGVH